jgi:hypothetical protein
MTEDAKRGGPERQTGQLDFDLVEDIGNPAAFERALDDLLPRGDLGPGGRFEIDPADFEAFNRELDAQMAQAKARSARVEIVEDLGTDVIAPPPARRARDNAPPVPERIGGGNEEPEIADDVVTLGTAVVAAASPPARAPAAPEPAPAAKSAPPPAAMIAAPPGRRSATLGVLLGLGGLLAGAAGLWLGVDRQAELAHLQSVLAERQAPAAVPAPSVDAERVRALEGQLAEVTRRLAELRATPAPAEPPAKTPPGDAHAPPREHASAAPPSAPSHPPAPAVHQQAAAPVQPVPAAPTTESKPEPKPAAKEPPKAATAAVDKPAAPAPAAPVPAALAPTAPESAGEETPGATSPTTPAQTLPKPSGHGSWSVVIDSFKDESVAEQRSAQLGRMGLPTEVRWYMANDQMRYRVVVPGYATRSAADAAAAELRRRKAGSAWVTRLPKQE